MNRRLLDPFQSVELPECIEEYLEQGVCTCVSFNRRGTLLAAGTEEGQVVVWDFDTRGVARIYLGHSKRVVSLSWSRSGKYLISAGADRRLILWDVLTGSQVSSAELPADILQVNSSTYEPEKCVVSVASGAPLLVDMRSSQHKEVPVLQLDTELGKSNLVSSMPPAALGTQSAVAVFNKRGDLILVGQQKGLITIVDVATFNILDVVKIPNSPRVLSMSLNRKGTHLLVNCHDRIIRLYDVLPASTIGQPPPTPEQLKANLASKMATTRVGSLLWGVKSLLAPVREFQNAVERTQWRAVAFSADCEHVVGAVQSRTEHLMYIYNRPYGRMERILEGPKEGIVDIAWHPTRSVLVSVSSAGKIYVWAKIYDENWSAFAPDFQELEENHEYVEREDEFDINPLPQANGADGKGGGDEPEEEVDITTHENLQVFSSDEEEEAQEQLLYLPVEVVADVPQAPEPAPDAELSGDVGDNQEDEEGEEDEESEEDEKLGPDALLLSGPRKRKVRWDENWEDPMRAAPRRRA